MRHIRLSTAIFFSLLQQFAPITGMTREQNRMFSDALEEFLDVHCSEDSMTVSMLRNSERMTDAMAEIIGNGQLSFAGADSSSENCRSRVHSPSNTLRLSSAYAACAISRDSDNLVSTYRAQVDFTGYKNAMFEVECRLPNDRSVLEQEPSMHLTLYQDRSLSKGSVLEKDLTIGNTIYGEVAASLSWNIADDIFTYPVQCWTTDEREKSSSSNKSFFLKEGCPNLDITNRGMATLIHDLTQPGRTRFSFPLKWDLVPKNVRDSSPGPVFSPVYIHCDVIVCSGPKTIGLLAIPNCPKSTFCNGDSQFTHKLPTHLKLLKTFHVVHGPMNARDQMTTAGTTDCELQCAAKVKQPQNAAQFLKRTKAEIAESIPHYHNGVETWAAALVAAASFVFGMATVATLWLIHVKTVPNKKLTSLESIESPSIRNEIRPVHLHRDDVCDHMAML